MTIGSWARTDRADTNTECGLQNYEEEGNDQSIIVYNALPIPSGCFQIKEKFKRWRQDSLCTGRWI